MLGEKLYTVYIVTNKPKGSLYIGITSNLIKRVWQHKNEHFEGFTKKYKLKNLVYFEYHKEVYLAIKREKQLKFWKRRWKIELIESFNPTWKDLYEPMLL